MILKDWKIALPLAGLFLVFVLMQFVIPKPLDWNQSFSSEKRTPYGNEALFNLSHDLFPDQKIEPVHGSIYQELEGPKAYDKKNYIFITASFSPSESDVSRLLKLVANGGNVFIAARNFSESIADTLSLETSFDYFFAAQDAQMKDSLDIEFLPAYLKRDSLFHFEKDVTNYYISSYDTANTEVVAQNLKGNAILIKTRFGKGSFIVNTSPVLFTNYFVLQENGADFIARSLSLLPVRDVYWDEYYKPGVKKAETPLRFILSEESLKWGYFLTFFSLIFFILFKAKRKQRIIPLFEKPRNTRLEFVESLGKLYERYGSYSDAVEKRMQFLLEQLRVKYQIKIQKVDDSFDRLVSSRSGADPDKAKALKNMYLGLQKSGDVTENDLLHFNSLLEDFKSDLVSIYGK